MKTILYLILTITSYMNDCQIPKKTISKKNKTIHKQLLSSEKITLVKDKDLNECKEYFRNIKNKLLQNDRHQTRF